MPHFYAPTRAERNEVQSQAAPKHKLTAASMNVTLPLMMDKPAFLAWVQRREGRYELAGGRVMMMMVGASRAHAIIVANLLATVRAQLDAQWTVMAEFGVDIGPDTLRYPDIVIDRVGGSADDHTATAPMFVAEVLSPSEIDLGDKAAEYLSIPSVQAYAVLSQNEPKAWIWVRRDGRFPPAAQVIAGLDKVVRIAALNLALPLAALYAGL